MAMRIARELRLEPAIERRCPVAGWLHDVGHGALPDDLLAKVGSLDDDELALMRAHPAIGAGLIESISGLEGAAPGVRHHHERYDGSGYPDGLVGDKIPIEARIVAAAEAYSAMTARSIYRPSRSQQGAMRELRARAGTQFDPGRDRGAVCDPRARAPRGRAPHARCRRLGTAGIHGLWRLASMSRRH